MKIGDDVWAICRKDDGEIVSWKGTLLIYESESAAVQSMDVLFKGIADHEVRRIRLLAVRVGRIDESEIDSDSKK